MKRIVVKLDIFDETDKTKTLQTVSSLPGIESISIDMKDRKLTVIGNVDPIDVVNKLRKHWRAQLLSFGSNYDELAKKIEDDKKKKRVANKDDEGEKR